MFLNFVLNSKDFHFLHPELLVLLTESIGKGQWGLNKMEFVPRGPTHNMS